LRATATLALQRPLRLASLVPQAFSADLAPALPKPQTTNRATAQTAQGLDAQHDGRRLGERAYSPIRCGRARPTGKFFAATHSGESFPSPACAPRDGANLTGEKPRGRGRGSKFWLLCAPTPPQQKTAIEKQCRHRKVLMRNRVGELFPVQRKCSRGRRMNLGKHGADRDGGRNFGFCCVLPLLPSRKLLSRNNVDTARC
jgi:hypothetical protein